MNIAKAHYINDFVLLISELENISLADGFLNFTIDKEIHFFLKPAKIFSNWSFEGKPDKIEIHCSNTFLPFFSYTMNDFKLITPNYAHIYELAPYLEINYDGIREFILFNTSLGANTFNKGVNRIFGVDTIRIENKIVKFEKNNSGNVVLW